MNDAAQYAVTHLPLSFADACVVVQMLLNDGLGHPYRVLMDGYEDDQRYLVRYEEVGGPSWDLPVILVDKASGWITQLPWRDGVGLPDKMRPVSAAT